MSPYLNYVMDIIWTQKTAQMNHENISILWDAALTLTQNSEILWDIQWDSISIKMTPLSFELGTYSLLF